MTGGKSRAWIALFAVVTMLGAAERGSAQDAALQDAAVQAAVQRFHHALESHDPSQMAALWVHGDKVVLVNPTSTAVSVGWAAVQENWRFLFDAFTQLKLTQLDGPHIQVRGDVAWATGIVNADVKLKSGASVAESTFETAIFEKIGEEWLLVSHVASTAPRFSD
jgi:ketosteroid isomerase-like protein